uniref:Uncharacterized protein n=1 Tax=viral metagenome TaxID=1070528 RepID=A0A6H1ZMT3_9ZZZZ
MPTIDESKYIISDWKIPTLYSDHLVRHVVAHCMYRAKNNNKYYANCFSAAVIDSHEMKLIIDEKELNEVKIVKTNNAIRTLTRLINSKLRGRCGLRYHKGYFSFQSVEITNEIRI